MMRTPDIELWSARVRYQTELSEKYHAARGIQLARMKNTLQIVTLASGAPAVALLLQRTTAAATPYAPFLEWAAPAFSALMALFALLDLILKVSDRATEHRLLAQQYAEIAKEIRSSVLTLADLKRIQDRIDSITINEPAPTKILLEARCHNELMRAYGFAEEYTIKTGLLSRLWLGWTRNAPKGLLPHKNLEADRSYYIDRMGGAVSAAANG